MKRFFIKVSYLLLVGSHLHANNYKELHVEKTHAQIVFSQGNAKSEVCHECGCKGKLLINLNGNDPISHEPFKNIIEKKQKEGLLFILALVKTQMTNSNETYAYHCYSASQLNDFIFGPDLSKSLLINPCNGVKITDPIEYFFIDSANGNFSYLGTDREFSDNLDKPRVRFLQTFFDINGQNNNTSADLNYQLARHLDKGRGVVKDLKKAAQHYKKAVNLKPRNRRFSNGLYKVGEKLKGYNFIQDAVSCFATAAQANNPKALFAYAQCLENGFGVKKNDNKAFAMYKKLVELENPNGRVGIANLLEKKGKLKEAISWWKTLGSVNQILSNPY